MSARIEREHHALIVWNDNTARRNALSPEYYEAIQEACDTAAVAGDIGAVVLAGEGGYFCSGGDLNGLATRKDLPKRERAEKVEALHDVIRAIRMCPTPVIAAVEGGAAGAGMSIALACDIVVMASDATMSAAYVKAALTPDGGLTRTLARLLPPATVLPILLTGAQVTARRLHDLGAVSELTEPGRAVDRAKALAHGLAHGPREAQVRIKRLAHAAYHTGMGDQLDAERDAMARAQGGPEAEEGISAFLEKRRPDYGKFRG